MVGRPAQVLAERLLRLVLVVDIANLLDGVGQLEADLLDQRADLFA